MLMVDTEAEVITCTKRRTKYIFKTGWYLKLSISNRNIAIMNN